MIRHYLTFEQQARELDERYRGWIVTDLWSQERDRATIALQDGEPQGEEGGIEISLDLQIGYALSSERVRRPRRDSLDIFPQLVSTRLESVYIDDEERAIRLHFSGHYLLIIPFFGKGGGNMVLLQGEDVVATLQRDAEEYTELIQGGVEEFPGREELIRRLRNSDRSPERALSSAMRRLGVPLALEALYRAGYVVDRDNDPSRVELPPGVGEDAGRRRYLLSLTELSEEELHDLLAMVDELYEEATGSRTYRIYRHEDDLRFSLIQLEHLEDSGSIWEEERFTDLAKTVRVFRSLWYRAKKLSSIRGSLAKQIGRERKKVERSLEHARNAEAHRERSAEWEKLGNLLLANLHLVRKGIEVIELDDWEGNHQSIRLDPKLTPAENADRLFRKARGARIDAERGEGQVGELAERLRQIDDELLRLESAERAEELEDLAVAYDISTDQSSSRGKSGEQKNATEKFRRFEVDGGYEVYVGKSAANNDDLTVRFAKPNDIWLHARGSSGSHVIIRWNDKSTPPRQTLEEAAMIAAFYSGAKHSSLVPVAWTWRKYVRKPKGAAPGAVVMTREEVVIVEPKLPEHLTDSR